MATRVFISFDYDNDKDLKELLVGQAKNPDSPLEISDASVKYHLTGTGKRKSKAAAPPASLPLAPTPGETDTPALAPGELRG
jgi:hypothetical protein